MTLLALDVINCHFELSILIASRTNGAIACVGLFDSARKNDGFSRVPQLTHLIHGVRGKHIDEDGGPDFQDEKIKVAIYQRALCDNMDITKLHLSISTRLIHSQLSAGRSFR